MDIFSLVPSLAEVIAFTRRRFYFQTAEKSDRNKSGDSFQFRWEREDAGKKKNVDGLVSLRRGKDEEKEKET